MFFVEIWYRELESGYVALKQSHAEGEHTFSITKHELMFALEKVKFLEGEKQRMTMELVKARDGTIVETQKLAESERLLSTLNRGLNGNSNKWRLTKRLRKGD